MRFWPSTTNERAEQGVTHTFEITADDATTAATNTALTITLPFTFLVGDIVARISTVLKTPFQATGDAAFNTTTFSVGDSVGGVATILAPIELNVNGTEILNKTFIPTGTPSTGFTAATNLTVTLNSMAAKALLSLNAGVVIGEITIIRPSQLSSAISSGPIQNK